MLQCNLGGEQNYGEKNAERELRRPDEWRQS
jgi:hypothetical protein